MPTPDTISGPQATAAEQDANSKVESDPETRLEDQDENNPDRDMLIDTMMYVEPVKRGHVPDHLLETSEILFIFHSSYVPIFVCLSEQPNYKTTRTVAKKL